MTIQSLFRGGVPLGVHLVFAFSRRDQPDNLVVVVTLGDDTVGEGEFWVDGSWVLGKR